MSKALNNGQMEGMPAVDSQDGLEARLLRLMEITLEQEQLARTQEDPTEEQLDRLQLRRNALAELMLHAEEGCLDHMNSLVRRSSLYMASLVAFILGMVLLGSSQYEAVAKQGQNRMLGYTTVPVKLQLGNQHNWNID